MGRGLGRAGRAERGAGAENTWGSLGPPGQLTLLALALGSPSCTPLVLDRQRLAQCGLVARQAEDLKEEASE